VHCDDQIDMLAAHKTHVPHRVFLKMNSGMNRLGFRPQRYRAAWTRLNALPQVEEISLMTHFSDADGPRGIAHQLAAFQAATRTCPASAASATAPPRCATRQDGLVRADWVRPGIATYGSAPDYPENDAAALGPAAHHDAAARVIAVQRCSRATPWATARALWPNSRCASASPPAATPTATRATAAPARRCWWTACHPHWWAA
jgi:alanine racemase